MTDSRADHMRRMLAALSVSLGVFACDTESDDVEMMHEHHDAAASDATTPDPWSAAEPDAGPRVPVSHLDASLPTEGRDCRWALAISCDGDEDCEGGQVCCGRYVGAMGSYEFIECRDSCEPQESEYNLCHEGDACAVEGRVCRRSSVLPYPFLAICASPSDSAPTLLIGGDAAGEINCGDGVTCGDGEKCCLSGIFDFDGTVTRPGSPYCVDEADSCDCDPDDIGDGGI